ncbi:MAG: sensor histidine kinase [Thermoplasmatota archaeon]
MDVSPSNLVVILLALIPAIVNVVLIGFVLSVPKGRNEKPVLVLFLFALVLWQLQDAATRAASSVAEAEFWMGLLGIGALILSPLAVHFSLRFTGRNGLVEKPWALLLLYGPVLAFEGAARVGLLSPPLYHDATWGWEPQPPGSLAFQLYGVWVAALAFVTIVILVRSALRRDRGDPHRTQALLLAGGFSIPVIQGTVTQVILPTAFRIDPVPLSSLTMSAFSLVTIFAILRYGFLQDPTPEERIRELETLAVSQQRLLEESQRIAKMGSWEIDWPEGKVRWSDEMYRIHGMGPDAASVSTLERAMSFVLPADRASAYGDIQRSVTDASRSARGRSQKMEYWSEASNFRIVDPTGTMRHLRAKWKVVVDGYGAPMQLVGVTQDVTEQTQLEEESLRAAERSRELEDLKRVNEFKTRFLNTAAHELNTPLTPIKIQLHTLRADPKATRDERVQRALDLLDRNFDRLTMLVRELLDSARIQGGGLKVIPEVVDLHAIVEDAVESFLAAASAGGISLETSHSGEPWVFVDRSRLIQVLYNLLSNALKFTPRGGTVRVRVDRLADAVLLSVEDTGMGMTDAQMRRLFEPFVQVHDHMPNAPVGTGLGLYISRSIVNLHGGSIWVESPGPGKGAVFHVSLPAIDPTRPPQRVIAAADVGGAMESRAIRAGSTPHGPTAIERAEGNTQAPGAPPRADAESRATFRSNPP